MQPHCTDCSFVIWLYRWKNHSDLTDLSRFKAAETEIGKDCIAVTGRRALVTKAEGLQCPICTKEDHTVDLKYVFFSNNRAV